MCILRSVYSKIQNFQTIKENYRRKVRCARNEAEQQISDVCLCVLVRFSSRFCQSGNQRGHPRGKWLAQGGHDLEKIDFNETSKECLLFDFHSKNTMFQNIVLFDVRLRQYKGCFESQTILQKKINLKDF